MWRATPFMTLVLLAALQSVPHEMHEAAQVDGAGSDVPVSLYFAAR